VVAVLAVVGAAVVVLLRKKSTDDPWTPAPTGDGPVPSYREDPVPSSPSSPAGGTETPEAQGKTVSSAETAPGDATPSDSDLGAQTAQPAAGPEDQSNLAPSKPATATGAGDPGETPSKTAGPTDTPSSLGKQPNED
jgi:hypothetical protein